MTKKAEINLLFYIEQVINLHQKNANLIKKYSNLKKIIL